MAQYRNIIKDIYQRIKYYLRIIKGSELYFLRDIRIESKIYGNYQAEWCIAENKLDENSIIYSVGVGTDISFDIEIINKYQCNIFAFDPTPKSIKWFQRQPSLSLFHFSPYGISEQDGNIVFYPPRDPEHVSFTTNAMSTTTNGVLLPVKRLITAMKQYGHNKIDLLKMDIEGAEYEVIKDILESRIWVEQLLVEFHHRFDRSAILKTREAINELRKAGYAIFYISPTGEEYSFIKREKKMS